MNSEIKKCQEKIRRYHSLPEAIVIDCKPIGYPFYFINLDLNYLKNRELELLEEFIMRCIENGINHIQDISCFLGINKNITEKVLSDLISKDRDLVRRENELKLTEKGVHTLKKQTVLAPVNENKNFYLDALSGKLKSSVQLNQSNDKNLPKIEKAIKMPRQNNVEDLLDYYEDIEFLLKDYYNQNDIQLIQVNKIEKVYLQWHQILLVLYKNKYSDLELEYETFSRDSIQKEYRETIEGLYAEGKKVLDPIFKDMKKDNNHLNRSVSEIIEKVSDSDVEKVEQISTKIASIEDQNKFLGSQTDANKKEKQELTQQLEVIKTKTKISEVIHTYELRDYLFKALKPTFRTPTVTLSVLLG